MTKEQDVDEKADALAKLLIRNFDDAPAEREQRKETNLDYLDGEP